MRRGCKPGEVKANRKCIPMKDIGKKAGFELNKKRMKQHDVTFKCLNGPWIEGYIGTYFFQARVFDKPSKYGIKRGRISNLIILSGRENIYRGLRGREKMRNIYNYDRGLNNSTKKGKDLAEKIRDVFPVVKK